MTVEELRQLEVGAMVWILGYTGFIGVHTKAIECRVELGTGLNLDYVTVKFGRPQTGSSGELYSLMVCNAEQVHAKAPKADLYERYNGGLSFKEIEEHEHSGSVTKG